MYSDGKLTIQIDIIHDMSLSDVIDELSETVAIMKRNGEATKLNFVDDFDRTIFDADGDEVGTMVYRENS